MLVKTWQVLVGAGAVALLVSFAWLRPSDDNPAPDAATETGAGAPSDGIAPAPTAAEAAAVSPPTPAMFLEPVFDILDCDRQDMIDRGQVDEHFGQLFAPRDTDRSHTLSLGEFVSGTRGALRKRRELAFGTADQNADGQLTADEFTAHLYGLLDAADSNKDGSVTRQELVATRGPGDEVR